MAPSKTFTTSELAEAASVGSQTLRYYERRGLLPEPPRTTGGHRIYGLQHLERLHFIQRVQCLGFHLEEIHELLRVEEDPNAESARALDRFINQIDQKSSALTEMRASLAKLREDAQRALSKDD